MLCTASADCQRHSLDFISLLAYPRPEDMLQFETAKAITFARSLLSFSSALEELLIPLSIFVVFSSLLQVTFPRLTQLVLQEHDPVFPELWPNVDRELVETKDVLHDNRLTSLFRAEYPFSVFKSSLATSCPAKSHLPGVQHGGYRFDSSTRRRRPASPSISFPLPLPRSKD
ncbi:hypothetical protein C8J56DRAFT_239803 [Mycena floridula]|nr:hypothetical protein C8J56DRAFT_239803 [Mycena floridula]